MARVITRCRLTGHYMFMGMDADPKEFEWMPIPRNSYERSGRSRANSVRSVPASTSVQGGREIPDRETRGRTAHPASKL